MATSKPFRDALIVTSRPRTPTTEEAHLFGDRFSAEELWLEVEISEGWRAALRLVPYVDGQPVVAEVRIFPADHWESRQPGTWRAHFLGVRARQFEDGLEERDLPEGAHFPRIGKGVTAQHLRQVPFRKVQRYGQSFIRRLGQLGDWTRDPLSITAPDSGVDPIAFLEEVDSADPELGGDAALELTLADFRGRQEPQRRRRTDAWPDLRVAQLAAEYVQQLETGSRKPVQDVADKLGLSPGQVRDAIRRARTRLGILTATTAQGRPGGRLTDYGRSLLRERLGREKRKKQGRG
jgi:hypothetical protein